jgi:hypothetical protein
VSFFLLVMAPLVAGAIILGGSGKPPPETHCITGPMHTVKDGNNNTVAEPEAVRCGLPGPPPP